MILYDDREYANQKLLHTIVRHGGVPVTILEIRGREVTVQHLKDERVNVVRYDELDITPVPLGYMNTREDTIFTCRRPMRNDWRQGLRSQTLVGIDGRSCPFDNISLHNTIMGIYPTFRQAVEYFGENLNSKNPFTAVRVKDKTAFNRDFALKRNGNIEYKGVMIIGTVHNGRPIVNEKCLWINETLEQVVN